MCDKITVIDHQHREILVAEDEMLALATISITISSPGVAFKIIIMPTGVKACSLVKGKGQIGLFFVFWGAVSDFNAGFLQWHALAETLIVICAFSRFFSKFMSTQIIFIGRYIPTVLIVL